MEFKYNFIHLYFNILCPLKHKITIILTKNISKGIHLSRVVLGFHKIFNLLRGGYFIEFSNFVFALMDSIFQPPSTGIIEMKQI